MLEGMEGQGTPAPPIYRPNPPDVWRMPDALRRIADLLGRHPAGLALERCTPRLPAPAPDRAFRLLTAYASTPVAGLELARNGAATLEQLKPFGPITVLPASANT